MAQPPTLASVVEAQEYAATMQKRATRAQRDASQAAAQARDLLIEFCQANGIPIIPVEVHRDN